MNLDIPRYTNYYLESYFLLSISRKVPTTIVSIDLA
jgi:hypothetical protein